MTFVLLSRRIITQYYHKQFVCSLRTLVLGIETSCDETGVAIVSENGKIIAEECNSQLQMHLDNGGIIPPVARALHVKHIDNTVRNVIQQSGIAPQQLSAIAVTTKPGLPLSLIIGKNYGKSLAMKYSLPVIPIHHMEAHALVPMIDNDELQFPFLTLLISGGHCLLAIVKGINQFLLLGQSRDDAPGDIFDKTARRLKLKNIGDPFNRISGGSSIEYISKFGNPLKYFNHHNILPLRYTQTCDFSFAGFNGLTNKLIFELENEQNLDPDDVLPQAADIAASLQHVITIYLIKRLSRALKYIDLAMDNAIDGRPINKLVISGGCACNNYITSAIRKYCQTQGFQVIVPPKKLCTDNGIMIAWNGVLKLKYEKQFPEMICRTESEILKIDIEGKAPFGDDISLKVSDYGITQSKINFNEIFGHSIAQSD